MRKELIAAAAVVLMVFAAGCTGTAKERPGPVNPSGPLLGASQAISAAEQYLYTQYDQTSTVIPFTLTTKMQGDPCAWNGTDGGNATRWMMIFEALLEESGAYKHITLAVTVAYVDGKLGARQTNVQSKTVSGAEADRLYDGMDNRSLAGGIIFDNHAVFANASAAETAPGASYLQSITMTLYDRFSSPNMPGSATWEVCWKYIDNDTYDAMKSTVVMSATSGSLLKVIPAG